MQEIFQFLNVYFDYSFMGVLYLTASLLSLLIGLVVLINGPRSKIHQWFSLITLFGSIWLFTYSMILFVSKDQDAYIWLGLSYLLAVPYLSPSVYIFVRYLVEDKPSSINTKSIFSCAFLIGVLAFLNKTDIFSFHPHFFGRFSFFNKDYWGWTGLIIVFGFFSVLAIMSFRLLYRHTNETPHPDLRKQYRQFFIGALLGYCASIDFAVGVGAPVCPLGFFWFTAFVLIIFYSIIRHRFLDINLFINKASLIILIYGVLITLMIPFVSEFLNRATSHSNENPAVTILLLSILFGAILSLGPYIYAYLVYRSFWLRGHASIGLAHELKSPLSAIQSASDIVLDYMIDTPSGKNSKVIEYMQMIQRNSQRLEEFVKSLLNVAKSEESSITLDRRSFDLFELISTTVESFKPLAETKQVDIQLRFDTPLNAFCDKEKVHQVISNLISNALKFSKSGLILISGYKGDRFIQISIQDQGKGISRQHIDHIFDRFYQADRSQKGSGIGLTIAKAWVEAHGGKIWAESEGEGMGAKVTFTLPV